MVLKLYAVSDGPPSLSVRQALAVLEIPFELIDTNFGAGEHMTEEYAKMNPQKEIPVLDDDGFYLSESNAILQYLCDKYKPQSDLYPQEPKARAIVNHRLCFNLSTYYANISAYTMAPIFFDYQRTDLGLKKVHIALDVFETYLQRLGTKYAAANHLTIADFQLFNSTMTLEAIDFDFSKYQKIHKWYNTFKQEYPVLWKISEGAMKEIQLFAANPPDLSNLNHPIHPIRKINK
ncbi:glutathione S-transferase 1-1 [Zerene cesonia]|uniref:glutathione S-transferase 1-1 n=1 Tax=Zerene cesonia TaxID=33412 RepID=UPI0018E528C5|nr:glutathione S-transferase 1-1 [Zerene cesonia]XP_038221762.1 glutathione S-transferase 1-1 [Zerene cesonia]XP_038221764.1 glutathione S-transferase 1-1 [Zerene cesonia]